MIWHLLLAHFIADYPLQPVWIIKNKNRWWALLAHAGIHFVTTLVLVGNSSRQVWPYLLLMSISHYLVDWAKVQVTRLNRRPVSLFYGLDQAAHYGVIGLTAALVSKQVGEVVLPFANQTVIYLLGFLLATYVWYITELVINSDDDKYQRELNAQFWPRMIARGAYLALLVVLFTAYTIWPAVMLAVVLPLPYMAEEYRARAILTDLSVAVAVAIFIQVAL